MHVIYAHDTVDESIYGKEDWSDLTGADANRYWLWPLDPQLPPESQPDHRRRRGRLRMRSGSDSGSGPRAPAPWLGELPDYEFSVDTRGNVTTSEGAWIENPQGVAGMVEMVRKRPGGRFRVTPTHKLVIVYGESGQGMARLLAGRLSEPLRVQKAPAAAKEDVDVSSLPPGASYPGPPPPTGLRGRTSSVRSGVG